MPAFRGPPKEFMRHYRGVLESQPQNIYDQIYTGGPLTLSGHGLAEGDGLSAGCGLCVDERHEALLEHNITSLVEAHNASRRKWAETVEVWAEFFREHNKSTLDIMAVTRGVARGQ